jgi:imidazole glycerol-phosphate synthase subunit HisH
MSETVIVDYGMANLRSVQKAFERVGHAAVITSDPGRVGAAGKLVLPGVGAFRDAIARLREARLAEPILDHLRSGKPFLGICLGLQLLFTRSFEDGEYRGLDWLAGDVVRFPDVPGLKVPHMGWNGLRHRRPDCPLLRDVPDGAHVYFVHSYYGRPADGGVVASAAEYPEPFAAVVWRDNAFATQFHPEKSQGVGQTMLRNFARL